MNKLRFTEKYGRRRCYYIVYEGEFEIGVIKQITEDDGRVKWVFRTPDPIQLDFECLSEIAQKVKELDDEYGPEPEEVKPAIRKIDLDD